MKNGLLKKILQTYVFNKYIGLKKLSNFFVIGIQHQFLKNSKIVGYPTRLVIDPINLCNLKCPLCPTGQGKTGQPKGRMKLSDFKKIIDELGDYLYEIDLFNWGEPFLNNKIYEIINYAHQKRIQVNISSNLSSFDKKNAKKLVESGLDNLIVSLDGASQESLTKYRCGGDFEKIWRA